MIDDSDRGTRGSSRPLALGVTIVLGVLYCALPASAVSCSASPLILDLAGDGVQTTDLFSAVKFDIHGEGRLVTMAWTADWSEDAFLWNDLNRDGLVDGGGELFGDSTLLPDGTPAANGFEALKVYDDSTYGGNADGKISDRDLGWTDLRLWIDRNHDGVSQVDEIATLGDLGISEILLTYREDRDVDGNGNWHFLKASFLREIEAPWGKALARRPIEDV